MTYVVVSGVDKNDAIIIASANIVLIKNVKSVTLDKHDLMDYMGKKRCPSPILSCLQHYDRIS